MSVNHLKENHYVHRTGWLRAAVLGANDGIVSISSLIVGVASAGSSQVAILLAGVAGVVAGAISMAAGEYVSVSSQSDAERADIARERLEIGRNFEGELAELTQIYVERGLSADTAHKVASELMAKDALAAHTKEELGIESNGGANPMVAAIASGLSFFAGSALPIAVAVVSPLHNLWIYVAGATLVSLFILGCVSGHLGGSSRLRAAIRIVFWGAGSIAVTSLIGSMFNI